MEQEMMKAKSLIANTKKATAIEKVLCEIVRLNKPKAMVISELGKYIPAKAGLSEINYRKCMHHLYRMNILQKMKGTVAIRINPDLLNK